MSWIDGPCNDEPERNVVPERDDEEIDRPHRRFVKGASATHFSFNQREYGDGPDGPRGTVRD